MSETIEQNDMSKAVDFYEIVLDQITESYNKTHDVNEICELIDDVVLKRGRGRPKKEPKPESVEPKTKRSKKEPKPETDEPKIKRPKGRPKIENPCKPGCPKGGRDYFKAYYKSHNAGIIINCPNCNAFTEKFNIRNHMRSKMCAKYSQFAKCQIIENSEN